MASEREWVSVSDLMSVLMMVFLFIAIVFMLQVQEDKRQVEEQHAAMTNIAETYENARNGIHDELRERFSDDLKRWNADILADGAVRFHHPDSLFAVGSSELSDDFKRVLREFFPRYIETLAASARRDDIAEIRVEGHTSSDWHGIVTDEEEKYINNAKLSQARSFAVLEYVYLLPEVAPHREWLRGILRANGVSYARPVMIQGVENQRHSRRVEFHTVTRAGERIYEILNHARENSGEK